MPSYRNHQGEYVPEYVSSEGCASPAAPGESLTAREEQIEKMLLIAREAVDQLEGALLPVLTDEPATPGDQPGMTQQASNLACWMAETTMAVEALIDRITRLTRRVDL